MAEASGEPGSDGGIGGGFGGVCAPLLSLSIAIGCNSNVHPFRILFAWILFNFIESVSSSPMFVCSNDIICLLCAGIGCTDVAFSNERTRSACFSSNVRSYAVATTINTPTITQITLRERENKETLGQIKFRFRAAKACATSVLEWAGVPSRTHSRPVREECSGSRGRFRRNTCSHLFRRMAKKKSCYLQCQVENGIACDGVLARYASYIYCPNAIFTRTRFGGINVDFIKFYDRCIRIQYRSHIIVRTRLRQTLTHLQHMTLKVN